VPIKPEPFFHALLRPPVEDFIHFAISTRRPRQGEFLLFRTPVVLEGVCVRCQPGGPEAFHRNALQGRGRSARSNSTV
jgi:hypothetical protein